MMNVKHETLESCSREPAGLPGAGLAAVGRVEKSQAGF